MGSYAYASALKKEGREVAGMISLEMLGYYSDLRHSQTYPPPLGLFYPSTADFIGLVGNLASRALVKKLEKGYRTAPGATKLVAAALPQMIGEIQLSDHWSFWRLGYPAVMVSDTAFLRNVRYHQAGDLPDTLDYERMAGVIDGLEAAIRSLR